MNKNLDNMLCDILYHHYVIFHIWIYYVIWVSSCVIYDIWTRYSIYAC